jgi:hypothetical protein
VNKAQLATATLQLLPDALALVRTLLERFQSVPEARAELRRIRDHGARLDAAEDVYEARIAAADRERAERARERDQEP